MGRLSLAISNHVSAKSNYADAKIKFRKALDRDVDAKDLQNPNFKYTLPNNLKEALEKAGMIISGQSNGLIEAVELKDHPWFVGVQFHPEFTSHLETPNPIILEFVKQATKQK